MEGHGGASTCVRAVELRTARRGWGILAAGVLVVLSGVFTPALAAVSSVHAAEAVSAQSAPPGSVAPTENPSSPSSPSSGEAGLGPEAPLLRADSAPATEEAARAAAARAASDELARKQAADLERLRAELSASLASEKSAREAAELRIQSLESAVGDAVVERAAAPPAVSSATGRVSLTGFVQSDWAVRQSSSDQLNPSTGAPLNQDRVQIRRARLKASLSSDMVFGSLEFDGNTVNGAAARIASAEAGVRWPAAGSTAAAGGAQDLPIATLTIGLLKMPFGFEVPQSDRERPFLERSWVARALFPGEYDVGARFQGAWRFARYAVAVMNGNPVGEAPFPARDPNHQKDVLGRVGLDTEVIESVHVAAGVSALAGNGFHSGTPASKPTIVWVDRNEDGQFQSSEIQQSPGVTPTPSTSFRRHALGADVRLAVTESGWLATALSMEAYLAEDLDRGILPADPFGPLGRHLREVGGYAALVQDVGDASLGVRYDFYNPDRDSTNRSLGRLVPESFAYRTWALMASLNHRNGRVIAQLDLNRNHLGRGANGEPTNLADDAFTVRGELKF